MRNRFPRGFTLCALLAVAAAGGCGGSGDSMTRITENGELRFATRNGPSTYFLEREQPKGFEYELAKKLADELGVQLRLVPRFSLDGLFSALDRSEADIAGASLALTTARSGAYPSSAPYRRQRPQVIYRVGSRRPASVDDLSSRRLVVLAGSSHVALLKDLQANGHANLTWESVAGSDAQEILRMVNSGDADVAIADSEEFLIQQNLLPRLEVAFDLAAEQSVVWYLAPRRNNKALQNYLADFFLRLEQDGPLAALRESYFGHVPALNRVGSQVFVANVREKLPAYRPMIERVAREHALEWALIAAIAYQESHWNPAAVSPTGVRGMMMLTLPTASELGISDREDPLQSLRGGARYFKDLRRRLPGDIDEPDRSWLALAAYNIGMGHLEDARILTERAGDDPHLWEDVMRHLPKLESSEYYNTLRNGYARGREAVRYVQNIRHYYNVLQWRSIANTRPAPPVKVEALVPNALEGLQLRSL